MLYDSINHTCLATIYPDVFKKSVLEIAALFIEEFQLKNKNLDTIKLALDKQLENQYPLINFTEDKIIGSWKFKNELLIFKENGKGEQKINMNTIEFVYNIENDSIKITSNNQDVRLFFLRKSKNIMYELLTQNKENKHRQLNFLKQ
jgi:hypothetical protein